MADIVLKDRNGRDVQYPGVNYLKVNTVDGGTQGFAAYDPETLTADNIKIGVEIGDVVGKMVIPDREEKTVDLDFSQGNIMTVMPSTGDELLFNESGVTFAPNPAANNMCLAMDASAFAFETGSEYQVHWDGAVYNCVAYDAAPMDALVGGTGSVAVGNGTFFNLQGNNEPFVFGTVLIGGSRMVILGSVLDTAEATHDVKIYKKIAGGNEKLLSKVNIMKPITLVPGNIKKDVDVAGVVGTLEIGGGGGEAEGVEEKEVCFYDYDGTPLYSYTTYEALAMTELPPLPSHDGLVCQGWTHTLEEMQSYIGSYAFCDIGAYFITDDGSTRIHISVFDPTYEKAVFSIRYTVEGSVSVDWGDEVIETLSGGVDAYITITHKYAQPGEYVIKVYVAEGSEVTSCNRNSLMPESMIKAVELGKIPFTCVYHRNVLRVNVPKDYPKITDLMTNNSLEALIMPSILPSSTYTFNSSTNLKKVIFPPDYSTLNSQMLKAPQRIQRIALPPLITALPDYCFDGNRAIRQIVIPNNVKTIGQYAFRYCYSLTSIKFPPSVTSLGQYLFYYCSALQCVDFSQHTSIPTLGSNAFQYVASTCKILVPSSLASSWKAASNWKTYASMIVGV